MPTKAKIEKRTYPLDNWSGEKIEILFDTEELSFELFDYKWKLEKRFYASSEELSPVKGENTYYLLYGDSWKSSFCTIHNLGECFISCEMGIEREHPKDPVAVAVAMIANLV